jgi:hypothetical protein
VPIPSSNVAAYGSTTAVEDDAEDDEPYDGNDLNDGKDELSLTISANTEQVDADNDDQEDGNPRGLVRISGTRPE